MKTTVKDAVQELYYWKVSRGEATNFTAKLYDLISKADPANKEALRMGFPVEVGAWEAWQDSIDEQVFFAAYGFGRSDDR